MTDMAEPLNPAGQKDPAVSCVLRLFKNFAKVPSLSNSIRASTSIPQNAPVQSSNPITPVCFKTPLNNASLTPEEAASLTEARQGYVVIPAYIIPAIDDIIESIHFGNWRKVHYTRLLLPDNYLDESGRGSLTIGLKSVEGGYEIEVLTFSGEKMANTIMIRIKDFNALRVNPLQARILLNNIVSAPSFGTHSTEPSGAQRHEAPRYETPDQPVETIADSIVADDVTVRTNSSDNSTYFYFKQGGETVTIFDRVALGGIAKTPTGAVVFLKSGEKAVTLTSNRFDFLVSFF